MAFAKLLVLRTIVGMGLLAAVVMEASSGPGRTLQQCYSLALERSTSQQISMEMVKQAESRVEQNRAPFAPSFDFTSTVVRQEVPVGGFARLLVNQSQTTTALTGRVNLFRGFRDFVTLRQSRLDAEAAREAQNQAKLQLFDDTAQAFYTVIAYEKDVAHYLEELSQNRLRKEDLEGQHRVVQAREADLVLIDTAIANVEAKVEGALGQAAAAREVLAFLTGEPVGVVLLDEEKYPESVEPVEVWVTALGSRPDVKQARKQDEAAELGIIQARSGHFPSVDLVANRYFARPGLYSGVDWDIQLSFSLPIYSGGLTRSQVVEAVSVKEQKSLAVTLAETSAERDVKAAYKGLLADQAQTAKLAVANEKAELSYSLLLQGNKVGNATNVDVLTVLAQRYQILRAWERARVNVKSGFARLQVLSGLRQEGK